MKMLMVFNYLWFAVWYVFTTHSYKLQKAQERSWPASDINPIYVSLSQTYMDLKDYKKAIVYYEKELEHYVDNPSEVKTCLQIYYL
jgi:tetratricopeptide (TPR) repeat protein